MANSNHPTRRDIYDLGSGILVGSFRTESILFLVPGDVTVKIARPGAYSLSGDARAIMGGQVMTFPESLPPGVTIRIIRKPDRVLIPLHDGGALPITELARNKEPLAEITFSAAGEYQIIVAGLQQTRFSSGLG